MKVGIRMQRFFDVTLSGGALLILAPLLFLVIVILRLTGEGEVFYRQQRVGKNTKTFALLKFATMLKNSEEIGSGTVTVAGDFRVLPVGRVLRKTKINELPQLVNIFVGDMSVIGPRPLHVRQFGLYREADQAKISSVRPGLSGVGSIFFRNEEEILNGAEDPMETYRENITPIKARLEAWYVSNRSLSLYFKLILLTVLVVLRPKLDARMYLPQLKSAGVIDGAE